VGAFRAACSSIQWSVKMNPFCSGLILALVIHVSEPPGQLENGEGAFSANALQKLDMELNAILEGQRLLSRKLHFYDCLGIGFGAGMELARRFEKLDERIFSRWKKPPDHLKKKQNDPSEKALKELDKQLSDIFEGQKLIYKKLEHFHRMNIGGPFLDLLTPTPQWDWPEDLKKLDEKIFGRWKKPPERK
jgi:hypothetical protein